MVEKVRIIATNGFTQVAINLGQAINTQAKQTVLKYKIIFSYNSLGEKHQQCHCIPLPTPSHVYRWKVPGVCYKFHSKELVAHMSLFV